MKFQEACRNAANKTAAIINDSIIMVSTIDNKIKKGINIVNAVIEGACERFRAVILTSLTTISGLIPLLFEGSTQAQFLKPMAVTIVFGLIATTFLVLFLVPALILVQNDLIVNFKKFKNKIGLVDIKEI